MVGGLLVGAIAVVSASAFVFEGRGDTPSHDVTTQEATGKRSTTTSSSTTSTTASTTTTTTAPPPPPTTAAPAPAPAPAPTPVQFTPPPPPPAPVSFCDGSSSAVIDAMNGDRAAGGLGGLCGNGQLMNYAQAWANTMAQNASLTHQGLGNILAGTAFSSVGENILVGPGSMSAGQMEVAWMNSPAHRENIMSGAYSAAGVGMAYSSDGQIWVCVDFGG
jgi:uncharacterized protein YkwD